MSIQDHIARTDNPHQVTKAQIGLSNVQNFPLATRQEVLDMDRNDRYIDMDNIQWVSEAFTGYMKRIGILDENGDFVLMPSINTASAAFYKDTNGVNHLEGEDSTANNVTITIKGGGQTVRTFDNLPIVNNSFSADVTTVTLSSGTDYVAELDFYDASNNYLGRYTVDYVDSNPSVTFAINPDTREGTLEGNAAGYDYVDVVVKENGAVSENFSDVPVVSDMWSVTPSSSFDMENNNYYVEVTYYLDGFATETKPYQSSTASSDPGTISYTDPDTGMLYYDFRRYDDLTDANLTYIDNGVM